MSEGGRHLGAELEKFKQDVLREQATGEPLTIADGTVAAALLMIVARLDEITGVLSKLDATLGSTDLT
jgi:hypothetical protein